MTDRIWEDCEHGRWLSPCPVCKKDKTRRLATISHEIRGLRVAALTGDIPHSLAREKINKLRAEEDQLWGVGK